MRPGHEDRRGPREGHARTVNDLKRHVDDAAKSNVEVATDLAKVRDWLSFTGYTGYYKSERDEAALALTDAKYAVERLAESVELALTQMRNIP